MPTTAIHVLTPFSRPQNIPALIQHYQSQLQSINVPTAAAPPSTQAPPTSSSPSLAWHPICHSHHDFDVLSHLGHYPWIKPILSPPGTPPTGYDPCYWKLNHWNRSQLHSITDSDLYCFACDDDTHEPRYFASILTVAGDAESVAPNGSPPQVIFTSMKRGGHRPKGSKHPPTPLIANPENVKVSHIGLEQFTVRGSVLNQMRFANDPSADGMMAEWLWRNFRERAVFAPALFAKFNFLEVGRWDELSGKMVAAAVEK